MLSCVAVISWSRGSLIPSTSGGSWETVYRIAQDTGEIKNTSDSQHSREKGGGDDLNVTSTNRTKAEDSIVLSTLS